MSKRGATAVTAEEAVSEILTWVENNNEDDGDDDLEDLNGTDEDNFVVDANIDPDAPESDGDITGEGELRGEGLTRRQHRRRTLTYQRDVNSIDTALDESNYNPVEIPSVETLVSGYIPDKEHKKKKIEVPFTNHKPSITGRQRRCDVINNRPGLTAYSKEADTREKAFALFLTDEMIASICVYTNVRINETIYARLPGSNKYPQV